MFKRFILAFIAILLTSNILFADGDNLNRYPLYKQTAPIHYGPLEAVNQMLEVEGFKPWALGFGKAGAKFNGQIVYAVAEESPLPEMPSEQGQLYWLQMPVICGISESVLAYIEKNEMILVNVSVGRDRAKPYGEPVFIVSYYIDPTYTQSLVVMSTMSGIESCILYNSFDLKFMPKKQSL